MRFYYDNYWRIWVRRLIHFPNSGMKMDISLTPINTPISKEEKWEGIAQQKIRVHFTMDNYKDFANDLPDHILDIMFKNLDTKIVQDLIFRNYVGELGSAFISQQNEKWMRGGGVPLQFLLDAKNK